MVKEENKLVVYVQADGPEYLAILERGLIPTLTEFDPDTEIQVLNIEREFSEALIGRTSWDRYKELMCRRIGAYYHIAKANEGKKLLFLDCDVIMIQNCKQELIEILDDCDMCFQ